MCYNLESSIGALGLGLTSAYLMYKRNKTFDKLLWPLIFTYSFVQLGDSFIWYDIDCGLLNKIGTYIAYYSLVLQPLAMGFSVYLISKSFIGIVIGILSISYLTYYQPKIECSEKKNNLNWGFDSSFYFILYALIICMIYTLNIKSRYGWVLYIWFTGMLFYFIHKQYNIKNLQRFHHFIEKAIDRDPDQQYASTWCHGGALSAPFLYLLGGTKF